MISHSFCSKADGELCDLFDCYPLPTQRLVYSASTGSTTASSSSSSSSSVLVDHHSRATTLEQRRRLATPTWRRGLYVQDNALARAYASRVRLPPLVPTPPTIKREPDSPPISPYQPRTPRTPPGGFSISSPRPASPNMIIDDTESEEPADEDQDQVKLEVPKPALEAALLQAAAIQPEEKKHQLLLPPIRVKQEVERPVQVAREGAFRAQVKQEEMAVRHPFSWERRDAPYFASDVVHPPFAPPTRLQARVAKYKAIQRLCKPSKRV